MPSKNFALQPEHPKRLEISWKGNWKHLTVSLDGAPAGVIETKKELQAGRTFDLADGSTLEVRLQQSAFSSELVLLRNGSPVPGSSSDPRTRLAMAYGMIFAIAGLSALVGIITEVFRIDFLMRLGLGVSSLFGAAIYAFLGFLVKRRSLAALVIAIGLFAADGIMAIVLATQQGQTPPVGGLFMRAVLAIPMIRGIPAIRALKRAPAIPGMG